MLRSKTFSKILAVAAALAVWQIAAVSVGSDLLLVSPIKVLLRLATIWREPGFFASVGYSFLRISVGFFAAFVLAFVLAVLAGRFPIVETILWPYVVTIKAVPVASFIIISLIWLNTSQLAVFISFLMVFPILYTNVLQGVKSTDSNLREMARVFRVPYGKRFAYIELPSLKPYLLSGCSAALGMSWKAGIAAEVIGMVTGSIGNRLYEAKIYLQTADLLAWTVVIVLISVLFEKVVLRLLKAAFAAWEAR